MTGPEHYREAERLLRVAANELEFDNERIRYCHDAAQAHATLALTAATANARIDTREWTEALT